MSAATAINWRRGLWRFWFVLSTIWLTATAVTMDIEDSISTFVQAEERIAIEDACFDEREKNPELGNPFLCFVDPVSSEDYDTIRARAVIQIEHCLALCIVPPLTLIALWLSLMWVVSGFKSDAAPRKPKPEMSDTKTRTQARAGEGAPIRDREWNDRYKRGGTSGKPNRRYVVPIAVFLILPTSFGGDLGVALCIAWHMYALDEIDMAIPRN